MKQGIKEWVSWVGEKLDKSEEAFPPLIIHSSSFDVNHTGAEVGTNILRRLELKFMK